MNMTMTAGPMAWAASGDGATDPTAKPTEELTKLSRVRIPRNLANLQKQHLSRSQASCHIHLLLNYTNPSLILILMRTGLAFGKLPRVLHGLLKRLASLHGGMQDKRSTC